MSTQVIDLVKASCQLIKQALLPALRFSQQQGKLRENLNLENCADYLLSAINGLVVTNRLEQDKTASASSVAILIEILKSRHS